MLNIAVNYGGRQEIAESVREIAEDVKKGKIKPSEIDMDTISSHLYTAGMPDPDLIIRPSGERAFLTFYCGVGLCGILYRCFVAGFNRRKFCGGLACL